MGLLKGCMRFSNPPQSPFRKGGGRAEGLEKGRSGAEDLEKGEIFLLPLLKGGREGL